jgi:hypothetical protein
MDYRAYNVGEEGRFIAVREIDAPDDHAALRQAKQYVDGKDVEVWLRGRIIGRIASDYHSKKQSPTVQLALRRLSERAR